MATRLVLLFIALSVAACGKSPWADYIKENNLGPQTDGKPTSQCPLLDADQIQWIQGPFVNEESQFQMTFLEKPTFTPQVELFMPEMGHGSAPVQIFAIDETHFVVRKVYFIMHGLWQLRIKNQHNTLCQFELNFP